MDLCRTVFYRPNREWPGMPHGDDCGDFMSFFWEGTYCLFYLYRNCVYVTRTKDFVHFTDPRIALACGSPEEQDWHIGTGSVFYRESVFYFYYTGFNEGFLTIPGKHEQVIMRATSRDLEHWVKDPSFRLYPDERFYGGRHWRDPQIFQNNEDGKYRMAVTAVEEDGDFNRGGCCALLVSDDCTNWEHDRTLYAPHNFATHECQDLFQIGDWWYMVFSNYTRWWETRYRMARTLSGPWLTPVDDMFDGRELYAAKTVFDGHQRFLVGWQSARRNMDDSQPNVWGGSLLVHTLMQRPDGTLGVCPVPAVESYFSCPQALKPIAVRGKWNFSSDIENAGVTGFSWARMGNLTDFCFVRTQVEWDDQTSACGLMLHVENDHLEKWCQVRLEVKRGRVIVDRFDRFDGDQSYIDERFVRLGGKRAEIRVILSGNIIVTYVNDVAISVRSYSTPVGAFGVFAEDGSARFIDTRLLTGPDSI